MRAEDLRRTERPLLAGAFSIIGFVGLAAVLAAIVLGLVLMTEK